MKLLIIDDEKSIRLALEVGLRNSGIDVYLSQNGELGLEMFEKEKIDIAIIDIKLPGIDGVEVLKRIRAIDKSCVIIMITYVSEVRLAVEAMKLGANDYFTKPFKIKEIKDVVEENINYLDRKREISGRIHEKYVEIIGNSMETRNLRKLIKKIGDLKYCTNILIQGESGTGKEIVAKSIHFNGIRKTKPFVALNCSAIPENLQESELFGYEKGAFTGANMTKIGLIEESNGGTLFLDEIGDIDSLLQAKLLRVLQEKKFRRVGGTKEIDFNCHIIAATNKDLESEVSNGAFREDLYYRLNVVKVNTIPLRNRPEDISLFINYFIAIYNEALEKRIKGIDYETIQICKNYEWKGNIRELRNVIERIMIFQEEEWIGIDNLPINITEVGETNRDLSCFNLEVVEIDTIIKSLKLNNWNITKTSEQLGISRLTLRRKIEKYEIKK